MKKMFKSFTSLALTVILLASVLTVTASAKSFTDMSGYSAEYLDAVNYVSDNNIMQGTTSTKFGPTTSITRAMAVTILYRMSGDSYTTSSLPFTDVSSTDYYYNAVGWAVAKGIANGTTETKFAPNNAVTNEQFVTFLYRYAQYKNDSVAIINGTISSNFCSDYSSISSYATTAFRWAIDRKIYKVKSSYVYPKSSTARIDAAYTIANYECRVVGIKFGRDNFSFTNSGSNFTKDGVLGYSWYAILGSDWEQLQNRIFSYYGYTEEAEGIVEHVQEKINSDWSGSCYGMSIAVALDKLGIINFNQNYSTMNTVAVPNDDINNVLSKINYLHCSQNIPLMRTSKYVATNNTEFSAGLRKLVECVKEYGLVELSYFHNSGAHTILVYGYSVDSNQNYVLKTCDPNRSTAPQSVTISSNYSAITIKSGSSTITKSQLKHFFITYNFNIFKHFLYNNSGSASANNLSQQVEILNNTYLLVDGCSSFVITNAEGETLIYDSNNNTFTGNMILLDKYYIVDGSMYLQVNDSESYTCEYLDNSSNFGIINDDIIYANVKGTNVDAVTIHNNGTIELDGMNMDYQISFNVQDDTYRKACITGKSNNITIDKTNLNVTANELNEALDFKMYKNSLLEFDSVSYESAEISSQDAVNILDVIESADIISQEVSQYEQ